MTLVVTTFLAILTLLAALGVVAVALLAAVGQLPRLRALIGPTPLWLAFGVALTATAGSLYLSEVAGFIPCTLCWYQRIAMYPLVIVLGIAAWRGDGGIRRYVVPVAAIGAAIAAYHVTLQRLPGLPSGACSLDAPCSAIYVERFGFVTIPVMALIAFLAILALLLGLVSSAGAEAVQEDT
jgi:disulfide bond formation protein DsbB